MLIQVIVWTLLIAAGVHNCSIEVSDIEWVYKLLTRIAKSTETNSNHTVSV